MALPESAIDRTTRALEADIAATLGPNRLNLDPFVQNGRAFINDPAEFAQWLVADVQQYFHDMFVDTTWPACPRHPNHPLWFMNGWWCCGEERLARFGKLSSVQPRPATVAASYDAIADDWHRSRRQSPFRERPWIERLIAPLPANAGVLDLGCGGGEPISRFLATSGFAVVGVDASARLLSHARASVPEARFVLGDMRTVDLDRTFDAIVAWDAIFHLPRADHANLFTRIGAWLRPGGRLLVSLGGTDGDGFTSEMYGHTFYYSSYDPVAALALLRETGFEIEHWEVDDPSSRGHIAIIAERIR